MSDKEWTKEYIKNLSEAGQRLQDLLAVKIEELATKDEEIALLRQELYAETHRLINQRDNWLWRYMAAASRIESSPVFEGSRCKRTGKICWATKLSATDPEAWEDVWFHAVLAEGNDNWNGWISVEDRLPEKPGDYLVVRDGETRCERFWKSPIGRDGPCCWTLDEMHASTPTHWMPMPKAPSEES